VELVNETNIPISIKKYTKKVMQELGLKNSKQYEGYSDITNPFGIQSETEKLLVLREREREFKDFNKIEKDGLRVFEKNIQTR
jgi:hypothetical protein